MIKCFIGVLENKKIVGRWVFLFVSTDVLVMEYCHVLRVARISIDREMIMWKKEHQDLYLYTCVQSDWRSWLLI